jgi:hypothetical protein
MNLKAYLRSRQKEIDRALDRYLPKASTKPATLHKAMRYSLFAGGKRLRPVLCLAPLKLVAENQKRASSLCALECIHYYVRSCTMISRAWITMISGGSSYLSQVLATASRSWLGRAIDDRV